jgi:SAM-dependent methyltransferase
MSTLRSLLRRITNRLRRTAGHIRLPDEPSGPELEAARAIAFIVNAASDAKGQAWIDAAKARGAQIDLLPFTPYRREDERTMSFLLAPPRKNYDAVVVNRAVELFEHSWSYAFLDRLNGYLSETGTIFIPRQSDPSRRIPDARLDEMFAQAPRRATPRFLAYGKAQGGIARPADAATSTLDAYFSHRDAFIQGRFDPKLVETIQALGVQRAVTATAYRADNYFTQLKSQSYRTCSASKKAAPVQHLAATYFPGRKDLRVADLGAGTGLNSLELLLNPSGVAHVTLVEPSRPYHWPIALMVDALGARVAGKVALSASPVEEYQGEPVDIAMVCGVFSILSAETREPFVQSAWRNVAPGGILAVLENMRDSDPVRGGPYNATRLSPPEIDAMLGRFGAIRYFPSGALKELSFAQVENAPVFRVVQKPLSWSGSRSN